MQGRSRQARPAGANLVPPLALGAMLVFAGIAYVAFALWPRQLSAVPADAPAVPITVAGVVFNVPPSAIRQQVQRHPGAQERIDLSFQWPLLEPPDDARRPQHIEAEEPPAIDRLFVTIAATDGTMSPAERLKTIYPRYMSAAPRVEAEGLAALAFGEATPYRGEDLVFDPAGGFVARCNRSGATPRMCLLERRIGAADVIVRFPRDWLAAWRETAARIDDLIARLRPPVR